MCGRGGFSNELNLPDRNGRYSCDQMRSRKNSNDLCRWKCRDSLEPDKYRPVGENVNQTNLNARNLLDSCDS